MRHWPVTLMATNADVCVRTSLRMALFPTWRELALLCSSLNRRQAADFVHLKYLKCAEDGGIGRFTMSVLY